MNGTNGIGFQRGASAAGAAGAAAGGLWETFEHFRSTFDQGFTSARRGRGDVRASVLGLLTEEPMHGYQIIREIEQRSGGAWKPSPGSVYPALQLLTDEGLISVEESAGKKTYSLTDAGRLEAESLGANATPWLADEPRQTPGGALPQSGIKLAQAAAAVARTGSPEQVAEAATILDDARRRLYSILAAE